MDEYIDILRDTALKLRKNLDKAMTDSKDPNLSPEQRQARKDEGKRITVALAEVCDELRELQDIFG